MASLRGYQDGRLEVAVPDRTWLREMESHLEELTNRLRREKRMAGLRGIFLVLEPAGESATRFPSPPPRGTGSCEPPPEILAAAEAIPDRDLARRWTEVVGRLLAVSPRDRPGR